MMNFKKYLEATTPAEKEKMIKYGQKGLEEYKKHKQNINIERKLIPQFLLKQLSYQNYFNDSPDIKYMDQLAKELSKEKRIKKAKPGQKINIDDIRIILSLEKNTCYYSFIGDYIHGAIVTYAMGMDDIETVPQKTNYNFTDFRRAARDIVGFEMYDKNIYFSESYEIEIFNWLMAQEQKHIIDKCYKMLREHFIFKNFYLSIMHDTDYDDPEKIYIP